MSEPAATERKISDDLIRLVYMFLFLIAMRISCSLICIIALVQFIIVIFSRKGNPEILKFSEGLSSYLKNITRYLDYNTEQKPWPFSSWEST